MPGAGGVWGGVIAAFHVRIRDGLKDERDVIRLQSSSETGWGYHSGLVGSVLVVNGLGDFDEVGKKVLQFKGALNRSFCSPHARGGAGTTRLFGGA